MRKFLFALVIILSGCVTDRNFNQSNVCDIFKTNPQWKSYAEKTKEKWGVPVSLQLSFIKQESSFNRTARPPRQKVLGFIPGLRLLVLMDTVRLLTVLGKSTNNQPETITLIEKTLLTLVTL